MNLEPSPLSMTTATLSDDTFAELVAKYRTLAAALLEARGDADRAETARDKLELELEQAVRQRDEARAVSACDELERDEWKETADTYLRQRDEARADARNKIARADGERQDAQKRAAKLEAQTPNAYQGAIEGLRLERDEARKQIASLTKDCEAWRIQDIDRCAELHTLRAKVAELERQTPTAYRGAVEGLRVERDTLLAEVLRLRKHLSPPPPVETRASMRPAADREQAAPVVRAYRETPKPRPDLIPAEALLDAGACLADRTDRDLGTLPWFDRAPLEETVPKYRASLSRHVLAYYADEGTDPESGRPHLAHAIVNAAILYRLENRAALAARPTANNPKES